MAADAASVAGRRLEGETVLVTGGAQGIGRAVVEVALREGAKVAVFDVDQLAGNELAARLPRGRAVFCPVDITDEVALRSGYERVAADVGPISVLVNNAGRNSYGDAVAMTSTGWDAVFELDLKAAWLCSRQCLPAMYQQRRGSIVNVASVHAHRTDEGAFPYAAAKSGLVGLTRSLALDAGPHGVRVNSVSPGYTRTRLIVDWLERVGGAQLEATEARHALRRIGEPREIAEVICFLASPAASFVTGAEWIVDGGLTARLP